MADTVPDPAGPREATGSSGRREETVIKRTTRPAARIFRVLTRPVHCSNVTQMSRAVLVRRPQRPGSSVMSHPELRKTRIRFRSWGQDTLHFRPEAGWPGDHTWRAAAPRAQGEEGGAWTRH